MELRDKAMDREDVEAYLTIIRGEYRLDSALDIPENFSSMILMEMVIYPSTSSSWSSTNTLILRLIWTWMI